MTITIEDLKTYLEESIKEKNEKLEAIDFSNELYDYIEGARDAYQCTLRLLKHILAEDKVDATKHEARDS